MRGLMEKYGDRNEKTDADQEHQEMIGKQMRIRSIGRREETDMVRPISASLQHRIDSWLLRDYRETFMERIELVLEAEKLYEDEAYSTRYGHTLQYILENISVVLDEGPIAGAVKLRIPTKQEEEKILAEYHRWWNIPTQERHKKILFYYSEGWLKCRPDFFPSFGHLAMDWEGILDLGMGGLKKKAQDRLKAECSKDQEEFLQGAVLCYDAVSMYIQRCSREAEKQGRTRMAADLQQIAEGPAETFAQALQLLWIMILILQKVCGCGVLNLSRMDQYLLSRYRTDLKNGILTEEEALELLQEFYFHNNEIMVQTDHMSQEIETTSYTLEVAYDDPNYLTLGGKLADGRSGVNELSFRMVEAARALRLRNPFIVVRYHEGIDPKFWKYCCDAMRENTTLVIYNDETMIPALKYYGVREPEVYDYGFFGCNDPNIPGMEGGLRQVWVNLLKPLELALNQGDYPMEPLGDTVLEKTGSGQPLDPECQFDIDDRMTGLMTGAYYGIKTMAPEKMNSMEEVLEAYSQQLSYLMAEFRRGFEQDFEVEQEITRNKIRIEDCFLKGTIENGVTWTEGGTKYHKIVTQGSGLATAIDALYAIEQICFVKKEMTVGELAQLLRTDYAGREKLSVQWKNKLDKFGNDIDGVDRYAKIVTELFVKATDESNRGYLYQMWPTYSTDRDFTTMGSFVGATPDGRRAKEQLSENQSPTNGKDLSGLTAMLNSVSKIPFDKITGGPLNLRLHPSAVEGGDGLDVLCALFKTYMEKGGMQLQVNVVDAQTLKEAQKTPEKYRTLCVRVTGYSAFFVEMGKKAQNELIERTEHLM
ncbi:MAG: pyruvate formate lyase family protein [Lachnospiraceae bacterium]|nr:pyruvate formate lyase family protein [Lachnospiraceae bacterium]MDD2957797.1 pyruvate formate lyase family protein [Lachnospiraceae bacterium]